MINCIIDRGKLNGKRFHMPRAPGDNNYSAREKRLAAEKFTLKAELEASKAKFKAELRAKDARIRELTKKLREAVRG